MPVKRDLGHSVISLVGPNLSSCPQAILLGEIPIGVVLFELVALNICPKEKGCYFWTCKELVELAECVDRRLLLCFMWSVRRFKNFERKKKHSACLKSKKKTVSRREHLEKKKKTTETN